MSAVVIVDTGEDFVSPLSAVGSFWICLAIMKYLGRALAGKHWTMR